MSITWIIVANHATAHIYRRPDFHSNLSLVRTLENPEGRLKDQEIHSDRPGRYEGTEAGHHFAQSVSIIGKHGLSPHTDPKEQIERHFAAQIATFLHGNLARQEFDKLILVANPHFLGALRSALDPKLSSKVVGSLSKNLVDTTDKELVAHLTKIFLEIDSQQALFGS